MISPSLMRLAKAIASGLGTLEALEDWPAPMVSNREVVTAQPRRRVSASRYETRKWPVKSSRPEAAAPAEGSNFWGGRVW